MRPPTPNSPRSAMAALHRRYSAEDAAVNNTDSSTSLSISSGSADFSMAAVKSSCSSSNSSNGSSSSTGSLPQYSQLTNRASVVSRSVRGGGGEPGTSTRKSPQRSASLSRWNNRPQQQSRPRSPPTHTAAGNVIPSNRRKSGSTTKSRNWRVRSDNEALAIFFIAVVLFSGLLVGGYYAAHSLLERHNEQLRESILEDEFGPQTQEMEQKMRQLEKDNNYLKDRLLSSEADRADLLEKKESLAENPKLHRQIGILDRHKKEYRFAIQKLSKYTLLERFGPGPHHVEINVAFHPNSTNADGTPASSTNAETAVAFPEKKKILLELALPDDMPHTVFWFLEQVSRGLYDGTSFHRSASHVVQGGPVANFMTPPGDRPPHHAFRNSGFEGVLMQEYSERWPHQAYSIGYAGRPGGPDFYINMRDNSRIHGPGGQTSYEDPTEADPCFGKVVAGFDVVDRMHRSAVKPGMYHTMEHGVAIVSMKIVKKEEAAQIIAKEHVPAHETKTEHVMKH